MPISELLQKARDFEEKYSSFIDASDRPAFHLSPRIGWMNDPNGFSLYQGQYHLFYQYHPYSTQWGPMHWGHAVSRDLLHWEYLPAALAPDRDYDRNGCFSGSAVELDDGRQLLLYTGNREVMQADGSKSCYQTQCAAVGDGLDYEKIDANPVLTGADIPEGFSAHDFRDPKLFRRPDGGFSCVVGVRTEDQSGATLLYGSDDGLRWHYEATLDRSYNEFGKMWECPDFFELDGEQLLLTSPQDMSQAGLEFHNGNGTLCLIGRYDAQARRFERRRVQAIDYGIDFYAPQTLLTEDGRRVMIGWMQNWDTCVAHPLGLKWFGQMSLPRELRVKDGRLIQNPVRELEALRGRRVYYENVPVRAETVLKGVYGRVLDMTVTVRPQTADGYELFRVKFAKGSQHYSSLSYRPESSTVRISRVHSGFNRDFVHERQCLVADRGGEIKLRVILDRFSAEIFVNDGEQALTMTFYTPLTADGISFEAQGKALIDVEKYEILES
ncbi:MAG: glycoside hydrolase family 32 protein [Oscillospiraceae bacterium]|nr:glycoside hydrolase family 32 protein [Oscillospiraceae bacterium]